MWTHLHLYHLHYIHVRICRILNILYMYVVKTVTGSQSTLCRGQEAVCRPQIVTELNKYNYIHAHIHCNILDNI